MTRDEAIALIHQQLGFRGDQASNIVLNMKAAQTLLEGEPTKPWFLVSEDSYVRTTSGEQRLLLPSDFLEETDEAVLRYVPDVDDDDNADTSNEADLVKEDYDTLRKNFKSNVSGAPKAYCLLGGYFRLFPTPDDDYLIRMIYCKKDTVLDTNVENGWLKYVPYVLMGKAGAQIASALRDSGALATFQRWEQEGRLAMFSQNEARKHANASYQIGGPHV